MTVDCSGIAASSWSGWLRRSSETPTSAVATLPAIMAVFRSIACRVLPASARPYVNTPMAVAAPVTSSRAVGVARTNRRRAKVRVSPATRRCDRSPSLPEGVFRFSARRIARPTRRTTAPTPPRMSRSGAASTSASKPATASLLRRSI